MKELCTAVILISSSLPIAAGTTWDETTNGGGDAGDIPGAEQSCDGNGALTDITGNLSANTDVDLYEIFVPDMTLFSADTSISPGTLSDTQLFLFDAAGLGLASNDDATGLKSLLPVGDPNYAGLPPGDYMIAIVSFNNEALSAGGAIFPDGNPGVNPPTGPGAATPLSSWSAGGGGSGTYDITLTGAEFVPNAAPTVVLSATTTFTGNAAAGFDLSVVQGAALTNANLDLTDPDGDDIDLNSVTPAPSAITGVTAPTPAAANPDPTTISWTGTVSAGQAPGVYTYTLDIDDNINPNVTVAVRITVTAVGGGGGGGGSSGGGTRGGGGGTANIFGGCLAAEGPPGIAFAALAVAFVLALRRSA